MKSLLNNSNLNWPLIHAGPPRVAGVFYFILLLIFVSCSSIVIPIKSADKKAKLAVGYQDMTGKDYEDHLASLKKPFIETPGIKTFKLDKISEKYLNGLLSDIISNNEIFFKKLKTGSITVLDTESPLHFSLPKGEIFISRGLVTKYMKHESMLACVLAFELVKSEKLLYPKQTVIPIGYVSLERMLTINRLELGDKMETHKWAYHLTMRTGFDGEYYLSWLQSQNRNTADFLLQVGDANQITREESLFKAFLIKNTSEETTITRKESSKNFYNLINSVRDVI